MKIFIYSTIISLLLWLIIQTTGYFLATNTAILLIVIPLYFWFFNKRLMGAVVLLETSLLIDIINYGNLPIYTLSSLVAGILYVELAEPFFTTNTTLNRILGSIIWLLGWRIVRLGWLTTAWLIKLHPLAPNNFSIISWLSWVGIGLLVWLTLEGIKKITETRERTKNQRSYA